MSSATGLYDAIKSDYVSTLQGVYSGGLVPEMVETSIHNCNRYLANPQNHIDFIKVSEVTSILSALESIASDR